MREFVNALGNSYVPSQFLTFDDIVLLPQYSNITSRYSNQINTSKNIHGIQFDIPIVSSNMDTITGKDMAIEMNFLGGLGILHRFHSTIEEYESEILRVSGTLGNRIVAFSVGVGDNQPIDWIKNIVVNIGNSVEDIIICLDIAHGHSQNGFNKAQEIRDTFPCGGKVKLCVGNIATRQAVEMYSVLGIEFYKVGVSPGACCQTRTVAGHGVPQVTAIMQVRDAIDNMIDYDPNFVRPYIIADGGIRSSGDIVKALAVGADLVMLGSMLAGTEETPGEVITTENGQVKNYRGQSSKTFMNDAGKTGRSSEGISSYIPYKGKIEDVLSDLMGGVRSGMSYSNCNFIGELYYDADITEVSHAGLQEGHTHILNTSGAVFHGH